MDKRRNIYFGIAFLMSIFCYGQRDTALPQEFYLHGRIIDCFTPVQVEKMNEVYINLNGCMRLNDSLKSNISAKNNYIRTADSLINEDSISYLVMSGMYEACMTEKQPVVVKSTGLGWKILSGVLFVSNVIFATLYFSK